MNIYVNYGQVSSYLHVQGEDSILVFSGGLAEFTTIETRGTMYVYNGGSGLSTYVSNNGCINICSGGIASRTKVYNGGSAYVFSGGSMDRAGVSGGYVEIQSGGWGRYLEARSGGSLRIQTGGSGYGFTVADGDITVMSGGTLYCPEVHVSGNMSVYGIVSEAQVTYGIAHIYDGGYANSTRISPLGSMYIYNGGVAKSSLVRHFMQLSSGGYAYDTTVDWKGTVWVSGGTLDKVVVDNGYVYVFEDGEVMNATLNSGGYMRVSSNGTANDTVVNRDGLMIVDSDANAYGGTLQDLGLMRVYGTANGVNVDYLGSMTVEVGGRVNKSVVNSSGVMDVSGTANGIVINKGGAMNIFRAGVANGTVIESDGLMNVSNGGVANDTYVQSWGGIEVYQNGKVSATTVISSGTLNVRSDGLAKETTVNENGMMTVYDEGMADSTTAFSHGYLRVSSGGSASNTTLLSGGSLYVFKEGSATETFVREGGIAAAWGSGAIVESTTVYAGGSLHISSGGSGADTCLCSGGELTVFASGTHTGILYIDDGACVTVEAGGVIDFDTYYLEDTDILPEIPDDPVLINDLSRIGGTPTFTLTVDGEMKGGSYSLAGGAANFDETITVVSPCWTEDYETVAIGELTVGGTLKYRNYTYSLGISGDTLTLDVSAKVVYDIRCDLLFNGCSQIVAWDSEQGKVGYVATDGNVGPAWRGVWEWSGDEAAMWRVVGVGRFEGSEADCDGILLYNGYGNTFAAWTDLNDPSYGYVSLCHVDGNFQTRTLTDLDDDEFDDVLIYDEKGSFGVVLDAAEYHDIWHVDDPATNVQQLIGAGDFGSADGLDSLLVKKTDENAYFLWHNNDPTFNTWNWSQTYIGSLDPEWSVAGIGDFSGDGVDDIAMWRASTGEIQIWENGQASNQRYAGTLEQGSWEVAAVGDYNGDGSEDLLLREKLSGWGGVGYWASADATQWTDLNARIETDMESKFTVIAG